MPSRLRQRMGARVGNVEDAFFGFGERAAITSFLITPFTIRLFGPEEYGMWAILTTILSYFGFADLGMSTASTQYATEAHNQGDLQREADVIWTSLLIATTSAAIFAILL